MNASRTELLFMRSACMNDLTTKRVGGCMRKQITYRKILTKIKSWIYNTHTDLSKRVCLKSRLNAWLNTVLFYFAKQLVTLIA